MADSRFHKNHGPFSLGEIADRINAKLDNLYRDVSIDDVHALQDATSNHLTFLDNIKYNHQLKNTKAKACILSAVMAENAPSGLICLIAEKPYKSYALAAQMFYPLMRASKTTIHPSAVIDPMAKIGDRVIVEANSVIDAGVVIGDNTHIGANVTISHSIIGSFCRIHNGARIGQDGFGFAIDANGITPVPQLGRVIIGDHVNIGSNTCIDRGAGPDTVIGDGTIIDNLVQIAHNVKIGKGCIITAQVGISGSTEIADYCVFGGQSGVAGHLKIGVGAQIGAQSGVTKDVAAGPTPDVLGV